MTLAGDLLCFLNSRSRPLFSADIKIQMVVLVLVLLVFCPPSNYHSIIIADASDNAPKPLQKAAGKRRSKAETVKWSDTIAVPWDTPVCYHLGSMIIHSDTLWLASEVVQGPDCGVWTWPSEGWPGWQCWKHLEKSKNTSSASSASPGVMGIGEWGRRWCDVQLICHMQM